MTTTAFSETVWPEDDKIADTLIAACLVDQRTAERAVELLTPEDMPEAQDYYRAIWRAVVAVVKRGRKPAPPIVAEEMRRQGADVAKAPGYADALAQLARSHIGGINVEDYCAILRRYSLRRGLRQHGLECMQLSNDDSLSTEEYIPRAEASLAKVASNGVVTDEPRKMGDIIREQLEHHKVRKPNEFVGLRTGFSDVDAILRGMKPADMIVLAARPSVGKTTLAQNIADNVAKAGFKPYFVSAEMPGEQVANRVIASEGGVDGGMMMGGLMDPRHWESVDKNLARSGLLEADYWIDDTSQMVAQIRAKAIRYQRMHGLDIIIIDYLQQLKASGAYRGQRVNEVSEISGDVKRLAKELRVPVVILSQLSREVEKRKEDERRPMLSDLRDSGSIEQDADVVAFLYRESYYDPNSKDYTTEVIISKNRNGPRGTAKLNFIPSRTKFVNLDTRRG